MKFTGERLVIGESPKRIENDHLARYFFASKYTKGCNVLDAACGAGYGSLIIATIGNAINVDAIDMDKESIHFANKNYNCKKIYFEISNLLNWNKINYYDVVICFETIEHISEYIKCLKVLYSNLKKGGKLIISSPNREVTSPNTSLLDKPKNIYHCQEFKIQELKQLLNKQGFTISENNIYGQRIISGIEFLDANKENIHNWKHSKDFRVSKQSENEHPRYFIIIAEK